MTKRNVLVTSRSFAKMDQAPERLLAENRCRVIRYDEPFDEAAFRLKLKDCHGLIIGAHPLSREAVLGAPLLKVVSKHGTGLDNIDLPFMEERGIVVRNVPAVNADAVADLTFGLMLDVSRNITNAAVSVRNMQWTPSYGLDVHGKTLGLIGFGRIAQCVARRALGFSMKIMAYDPFLETLPEEFRNTVSLCTFQELLREGDIISVHVPLNQDTHHMITREELAQMKPTGILINTSRGGVVQEQDLSEALEQGVLYGAGLDVLAREPIREEDGLGSNDKLLITPHIGMYSRETLEKISLQAARNIIEHLT